MIEYDIIAYIEGRLSGEALESFEAQMKQNSDFAEEVELQRQLVEDLEMSGLRQKINDALIDSPDDKNSKTKKNLYFLIGSIIFISALLYFFIRSPSNKPIIQNTPGFASEPEIEQPSIISKDTLEEKTTKTIEKKEGKPDVAIPSKNLYAKAVRPVQSTILKTNPVLRGVDTKNETHDNLIEKIWQLPYLPIETSLSQKFNKIDLLIKSQDYEKAYVRIKQLERKEPANDTLLFLKSHCLLQLGEGIEALSILQKIDPQLPQWNNEIDWYFGMAYIVSGNYHHSKPLFKYIANKSSHLMKNEAIEAIEALNEMN